MKKRIFAAIDISDKTRQKITDYIAALSRQFPDLRVGWENPQKLHLTLKFFGDVDENGLENIKNALAMTARKISKFNLMIYSTGVFPNLKNPKILWLGVNDESHLLKMTNERLENNCADFGFIKEKRSFKPHLTIARLREPNRSVKLAEIHIENEFPPIEFQINEIVIYESTLLPNGSIYQKIGTFALDKN